LALSTDGQQLAFAEQDAKTRTWALKLMAAAGGEARELLRVEAPETITTIAWMPDGRHLLFGRGDWPAAAQKRPTELWRIAADGGESQRLGVSMDRVRELHVHPDGRQIAFTAGWPELEVWVMEGLFPSAQTAQAPALRP
jgi:Tol biopolymer transport system component